jgi:hypothetical protein
VTPPLGVAQQFDELASSTLHRLFGLRVHLSTLSSEDYATGGSAYLVQLIQRLTHFYETAIRDLKKRHDVLLNAEDVARRPIRYQLISISQQISDLSKVTRYAETSRAESSPTDLPAILEALVQSIHPTLSVVVRPQNAYGYEYVEVIESVTTPARRLLQQLRDEVSDEIDHEVVRRFSEVSLLAGLPTKIGVINYPKIEGQNVLRHAFGVGHELGHLIETALNLRAVDENGRSPFLEHIELQEIQAVTQKVANLKGSSKAEAQKLLVDTKNDVQVKFLRWLTEIVSDIVAVNLAGPAAVSSFLWMALGEDSLDFVYPDPQQRPPASAAYYPPLRLRLKIMVRTLEVNGFVAAALDGPPLEDALPSLAKRIRLARDLANENDTAVYEKEHEKEWPPATAPAAVDRRRTLEIYRIVAAAAKRAFSSVFGTPTNGEDLLQRTIRVMDSLNTPVTVWVYKYADCAKEAPALVRQLRDGTLPCQTLELMESRDVSKPARVASILVAGWEQWLTSQRMLPTEDVAEQMANLNALLATALETSQLQRRFRVERARTLSRPAALSEMDPLGIFHDAKRENSDQ